MLFGFITKKDLNLLKSKIDELNTYVKDFTSRLNDIDSRLVNVENRESGLYASAVIEMPMVAGAVTIDGYFLKEITGLFTIVNGQPVQISKYGVGINQQGQLVNCNLIGNVGQTVFVLFKY